MTRGRRDWLVLGRFLLVTLAVGQLGGLPVAASIDSWYPTLRRPALTPPDWAFPVVWTLLYVMMAVAAWLVWRQAGGWQRAGPALWLWSAQLLVNGAWPFLYFGLRNPLLGLLDILVLLPLLVATIVAFARRSRTAALLLLPYLLWAGFAALLNFEIWRLN